MNQIDNIMKLVNDMADEKVIRAAIEAALKMEQLNYAGCMEDLAEAEKALGETNHLTPQPQPKQEPVGEIVCIDKENDERGPEAIVALWGEVELGTKLYLAPQPQPKQEPVAWLTKKGSVWKSHQDESDIPLYTAPPPQPNDTALLRQALFALEYAVPVPQFKREFEAAIAALRERLK